MATREIKTTIALDGEQQFKQALSSASREMRVMESELRAVSAAYDTNGDAAAFFTAKQRNLQGQIRQQEQIVQSLERAVRDSAEAFGEASPQVDGYSIKLNNARTRLSRLQKELNTTDREVEELGRDSVKAGRQIEQGISEGAQEAEQDLRSMMDTMQDSLDSIRSSTAVTAVKTVWDMAKGAYSAVSGFVDGTVDYRRQLSFLAINADTNNFDFENIKEKLIEVTGVTGEASSAIETLSNLMAIEDIDASKLERALEGLGGAVVSFPDTMKFESLADSLQETIATGEAAGQFSELLGRMGVDVEAFNKALEESETTTGDLEIALAYLAAGGMTDVYNKWRETNSELIRNAEQTAELEDAYAGLAAEIEPLTTGFKELWTELVRGATNAIVETKKELNNWAEEQGWTTDATGATGAVDPWFWGTKTDYTESPFEIIDGKLVERGTANQSGIQAGQEYADGFISGLETQLDLSLFGEGRPAESHNLVTINPIETWEEMIQSGETDLIEAGKEAGEAVDEGFSPSIEGMETAARETGASVAAAFGAGLASQISYVAASSAALAAAASAGLRAVGSLGPLKSAASTGVPVVINLDGRQVGSGLAPFTSEFIASSYDADVNIN